MRAWILLAVALGGCEAVIPETMGNMRTLSSQDAYKKCLLAAAEAQKKGEKPASDCEVERKIYEIDKTARK